MHILFVTSTDPATNPRTVKEIEFALNEGHKVSLVHFNTTAWAAQLNQEFLRKYPEVNAIKIDESWWRYRFKLGHIWNRLSIKLVRDIHWNKLLGKAYSQSERAYYLKKKLSGIRFKPDLVVAHNLPAFAPALHFAKQRGVLIGIDVEDYHPGERIPEGSRWKNQKQQRENIMKMTLPRANYVSYASPLIREECLNLTNMQVGPDQEVINNAFWSKEFELPQTSNTGPLRLVWFSQNIGAHRGLEELMKAVSRFSKDEIELKLIGNVYPDFFTQYIENQLNKTEVIPPVSQSELHKILSNSDVGLALENSETDANRNICLTNKIWAYFQAGLFVSASDTKAQEQFLQLHNGVGKITQLTPDHIEQNIRYCIDNLAAIRNAKQERFEYARKMAFEAETDKLKRLWTIPN